MFKTFENIVKYKKIIGATLTFLIAGLLLLASIVFMIFGLINNKINWELTITLFVASILITITATFKLINSRKPKNKYVKLRNTGDIIFKIPKKKRKKKHAD